MAGLADLVGLAEVAGYAEDAARLVNTEQPERGTDALVTLEAVRELLGPARRTARRATEADVGRLRAVRGRLRSVFEAAADGEAERAVDLLNALMLEFPVSPRIAGRLRPGDPPVAGWHLDLADHGGNATAAYAAAACAGLALRLTALGVERLGVCQAAPCRNVYLDTSTNRSRRYCSDRCATRANVAAYRARRRGAAVGGTA